MIFSIRSPKSKRYVQLSFKGFTPRGGNFFSRFIRTIGWFSKDVSHYISTRFNGFVFVVAKTIWSFGSISKNFKSYIIRRLIWSRGKLGRPIAMTFVLGASFIVFLFGEVLNSSDLVVNQEVNADYLTNSSDIIPNKYVATTTLPEDRKRTEPFEYTVQDGDSLYTLGTRFRISVEALRYVNKLTERDSLSVGKVLVIPPVSGLVHKVAPGENLSSIASKYSVPSQAIADFNYILNSSSLKIGTELVIPGGQVPKQVVVPVFAGNTTIGNGSSAAPTPSSNYCVWVSSVRILTQTFSWYHDGVDIAKPHNISDPPLFACTEGTVTRAGWDPFGLGLHVRIDHGDGYETIYGHMNSLGVSYGQSVSRGQTIGLMGNTGRSTGPHVHFTIKYKGVPQNPLSYMN